MEVDMSSISQVSDLQNYKRTDAKLKLQHALEEGERSAEQKGWMMAPDIRKKYKV